MAHKYKKGEEVVINGHTYKYQEFYERLELLNSEHKDIKEHVACPHCHSTAFTLSYGDWEIIANCKCGHSMTVYDG